MIINVIRALTAIADQTEQRHIRLLDAKASLVKLCDDLAVIPMPGSFPAKRAAILASLGALQQHRKTDLMVSEFKKIIDRLICLESEIHQAELTESKEARIMRKIIAALPVQDADRGTYETNYNPTEYPLFTQDAADHCPSARYVGGISRWLCECADPKLCRGVIKAQLNAGGVRYTRKDYMDGLKELDGKARHNLYYSQFVTRSVVENVLRVISVREIMKSADEHFNDIPLRTWDNLGLPAKSSNLIARANVFTYRQLTAPGLSQADQVCVNKQVARIIKDTLSVSTVGTCNFLDANSAVKYYASYGFDKKDVARKIADGEINIFPPTITNRNYEWFTLDADNRYQIHIIE